MSPGALLAGLAGCLALAAPAPALAGAIPARSGERGIIDVPDAEVSGTAGGQLAAELRLDRVAGRPIDAGPLPLYAVMGVTSRLDAGLTMREWGQPGDPRPSKVLFGAAAKLQLLAPRRDGAPGVALSAVLDRMNERSIAGARLAMSSTNGPVALAGYLGAESATGRLGSPGFTIGAAAALGLTRKVDFALEALAGPRGQSYGGALRFSTSPTTAVSFGANYLPRDEGLRFAITVGFSPAPKPVEPAKVEPPVERVARAAAPEAPRWADDRPRFRLRIPERASPGAPAGHLQHAPWDGPAVADASARPGASGPPRPAAPSLDDLATAQIRESEALADTRQHRASATARELAAREKAALAESARLDGRARELATREQLLDAREKRMAASKGPPTEQRRRLESVEAQLSATERELAAQERSFVPAIDSALGRERDAAAREDAERQEAKRLATSVGGASSRALQLEIRKQLAGSRNRELAALEARLAARGDRIGALERQLRAKTDRLHAWSRRLDARTERLDLLERHAAESRPSAAASPLAGADAAPKQKAAFVMVVKAPTAIAKGAAPAPAAVAGGAPLHLGAEAEKTVAAATVTTFAKPADRLSELDGEAIDAIARLAAKERCELLIWARAKDPSLMAEAGRRASEIRARALRAGPLDEKQVVNRITTRPGTRGVDVLVSALRQTAKPASAPAPGRAQRLLTGASGMRQIREALQGARESIEACVGEIVRGSAPARVEGSLRLTVSAQGRVSRVTAGEGDLAGTQFEDCLGAAAGRWQFPPTEAEYVVDVPITVILKGASR